MITMCETQERRHGRRHAYSIFFSHIRNYVQTFNSNKEKEKSIKNRLSLYNLGTGDDPIRIETFVIYSLSI